VALALSTPACSSEDDVLGNADDDTTSEDGAPGDDGDNDDGAPEDDGDDDGGDDGNDGTDDGDDGDDGNTGDGGDTGDEPPAQECSSWEAKTGVPSVDLFDIAWLDADRAFVVGLSGTAIATDNGGDTWVEVDVGTNDDLRSVSFAPGGDSNNGWILGGEDVDSMESLATTIRHTTNGGASWTGQSASIFFPPTRVEAISAERAMAIWALGHFHPDGHWQRTFDGGNYWEPAGVGFDFMRPLRALMDVMFVDESTGWAVGTVAKPDYSINGQPSTSPLVELGGILHTKDGGDTWVVQATEVGLGVYFMGVFFVDTQQGWVVDEQGHILATDNGGDRWTMQSSGVSSVLRGILFKDLATGWAVGDGGVILHTTDGGTTWEPQQSGTTSTLRRMAAPPGGNPWAVGNGGTLLSCI